MQVLDDPFLLFAYGTLRRGEDNAAVLRNARLLEPQAVLSGYRMLTLGDYPGIVADAECVVKGELYEVPATLLGELDRLEDYPELYDRVAITLESGVSAIAYVLQPMHAFGRPTISSGDWTQRAEQVG